LRNIAALGGMNNEVFNNCMQKPELDADIRKRTEYARIKLDISGTPTFFINGEKVKLFSEDSFKIELDKFFVKTK